MEKELKIADLLAKAMQNHELNIQDREYLDEWMELLHHKNIVKDVFTEQAFEAYALEVRDINSKKAFDKVIAKSKAQRRIFLFKRAVQVAAIIIPGIFMAWAASFLFDNNDTHPNVTALNSERIQPEITKAVLVLGNGESVELDAIENNNIREIDGTVISNNGGVLEYDAAKVSTAQVLYNTVKVPRGREYQLTLSDGSKVWLNADSEIKYPVQFSGQTREVWICGEVFFDVYNNKEKPFRIYANDLEIEVLGTQFNVQAYKEDNEITTTLVEGAVRVTKKNEELILKPNQQAVFSKDKNLLAMKKVEANNYALWKQGVFYADGEELEEIMEMFERWYDVDVSFESEALKSKVFSIEVPRYLDIDRVLDIISATQKVKFYKKGNQIVVK